MAVAAGGGGVNGVDGVLVLRHRDEQRCHTWSPNVLGVLLIHLLLEHSLVRLQQPPDAANVTLVTQNLQGPQWGRGS